MFLFKKVIAPIFFPVPLCIELLLVGFIFLAWTSKQRFGKFLIGLSLILLLVFSNTWIADQLLIRLEQKYSPQPVTVFSGAKYVVVLGGGNQGNRTWPATMRLSQGSMMRLIEAIRIHRAIQGSKLLLSGGSVFGSLRDAEVMAQVAESIGISRADMIVESESRDTEDEAKILQPILKQQRFVLVTSASHMPRSVYLFRKYGMHPLAAPTDFLVRPDVIHSPSRIYPNSGALGKSEKAFHEYLGIVWGML